MICRCMILLFSCIASLAAQAQNLSGGSEIDFAHYSGLLCGGELPLDFKQTSVQKLEKQLLTLDAKDLSRKERNLESEHLLRSVFAVDEILMSGRVLYGDPLSDFVEAVGLKLLAANDREDLMSSLRFYVLKSNEVNAYATSNGVVMVTVGLLSRIENESQLAFILAHEIQHYIQKHSLQQFKNRVKKKKFGQASVDQDEKLKELYQFSKEHENEADMKGFEMMVKSGYDLVEGVFVFDMLKYGDYPFLETQLNLDSFEHGDFRFPKTLKDAVEKQVAAAEIEDEKHLVALGDEDYSTHPSLDRRVVRLRDMISGEPKKDRVFYLVGEAKFKEMQKIARHELLLVYVQRADFVQLIYLTHIMRRLYGESVYFDQMEAMGLYGFLFHKTKDHDLNRYGSNVASCRGDWRALICGLRELDVKSLSAFTSMRLWEIWQRSGSEGTFIDRVSLSAFEIVQREGGLRLQDFIDYLPAAEAAKLDSAQAGAEVDPKLKNPRSRVARSRAANVVSGEYYMSAFYQTPNRAALQLFFDRMKYTAIEPSKETKKSVKKTKRFPAVKDMKRLVMFEPRVECVTGNNESSSRNLFEEQSKKKELVQLLMKSGRSLSVNVDVLPGSTGSLGLSTERINQYMLVNDWMMERLNNDTQSMLLYSSQTVGKGMQGKGASVDAGTESKYLAWSGYEMSHLRRKFEFKTMALCLVLYPTFPYYLFYQLGSEKDWDEFMLVYDVSNGRLVHVSESNFSHKSRKDFVKSRVYNNLYEVINGIN